ncbi:MAG: hypothetical protein JSS42_04375 [Proteobacteria bacterium]|nr:hypothetical protein [Pseudomonadota bacterium]
MLKLAAMLSGLALLPRVARSVARLDAEEPGVFLARVDEDGRLHRVRGASAAAGTFRVRTQDVEARMPFALGAYYGDGVAHRFWHAWRNPGGEMAQSHGAAVICHARSTGLSLSVRTNGRDIPFDVPAVAGTYVLAITAQAHEPAAMEEFRLLAATDACRKNRLLCRGTQVPADFSHVVLAVEPLAV